MSDQEQKISIEQATLHFLMKCNIHSSEVDAFIAVRNHFQEQVNKQAVSETDDDPGNQDGS